MTETRSVRDIQRQVSQTQTEILALRREAADKQRKLAAKEKTVSELQSRIEALQNPGKIEISDHALVRYMERVVGIDLETIRKEILCDNVLGLVSKLGGTGHYPTGKGNQVVMKNNIVVTII